MKYQYEFIDYIEGLPFKAFVHSVNDYAYHWHKEIEFILVLKGSVEIRVGSEVYTLKENDLILLNRDEVHSTGRTEEDNILLVLQISSEHFSQYYPNLACMTFDCKSIANLTQTNGAYDIIRQKLADIIWEINKKVDGYGIEILGMVHQLLAHVIRSFDYRVIDEKNVQLHEKDLDRLKRITDYVNENYAEKITLKDIADREFLSFYYLSHFIKDKMGISFQAYLTEIRLEKAIEPLLYSKMTISEIVFSTGFANTKSFNKAFKTKYDLTPSAYRKKWNEGQREHKVLLEKQDSLYYLDFDKSTALSKIFQYRSKEGPIQKMPHAEKMELRKVTVPAPLDSISISDKESVKFHKTWKRLTTFGRAIEGLRADFQEQLRQMQKDIGFEYMRFHGIFNDEMMVLHRNDDGRPIYNWHYVDKLIDMLLQNGVKPFLELGLMPSALKSSDETVFEWKGNISPPKDIRQWAELIEKFVSHLIDRYGLNAVLTWRFEVWNEPDLEGFFWAGTKEDYFELYKETVLTIKSIHPDLQVGGPSVAYLSLENTYWTESFLKFCKAQNVSIDFFTYHVYAEDFEKESDGSTFGEMFQTIRESVDNRFLDADHLGVYIEKYNKVIREYYGKTLPVYITEWNASAWSRNLIHDTCFKAPYIIENAMNSDGKIDGLGYWVFTDIFEELGAGPCEFHGGFGFITQSGLPKPGYYAYKMLSKLGDEILAKGDGFVVTRRGSAVQILLWNFAYYDTLFRNGDISALDRIRRYDVFEQKLPLLFKLKLEGVSGKYKAVRTRLNRESGSVFDAWVRMGAPENMSQDDVKYLKTASIPQRIVESLDNDKRLEVQAQVPVHGVELIELCKER